MHRISMRRGDRQDLTSEGIDGYEDGSDICVDLAVGPPFLEVLVDALVADCGEEGHVGYADLLLFEAFLPISLSGISAEIVKDMW